MRAYETIIVGINFERLSKVALEAACDLAERIGTKRIHVVHVAEVPPAWALTPGPFDLAWDEARTLVAERLKALEKPKTTARVTHETRLGPPARELAAAAAEVSADLLIVASHRRGRIGRLVVGSVASTLLRVSPCPVLVVGEDRSRVGTSHEVMAAIDLSPISSSVLHHAARWANRVRVLSIDEVQMTMARLPPDVFQYVTREDAIRHYDERYRADVQKLASEIASKEVAVEVDVQSEGLARDWIVEMARKTEPDLLVIGTSGHSAWQRLFLGSTAAHVVQEAPCPVLIVPTMHEARPHGRA